MSVSDLFEISKQGMDANRAALQTTSQNIANANTPGHNRQQARMTSQASETTGSARTGGVRVKEVVRVHDEFVEKQLLTESKTLSANRARRDMLGLVESAVHNEGFKIQDCMNEFFNGARELSTTPESKTLRAQLVKSADNVASSFRTVSDSLHNIESQIDLRVKAEVDDINRMARQIAELNGVIQQRSATGEPPLELMDHRDELTRELAKKIDFQSPLDDSQNTNIHVGGVGILVQGTQVNELSVHRTEARDGKHAGLVDVFLHDFNGERNVTHGIKGGEMGGLLQVRDQVIRNTLAGLDHAAFRFASSVNEVHSQGTGLDDVEGRNLFKAMHGVERASESLRLDETLAANPDLLATGFSADTPSDNRVALALSDIQNAPILDSIAGNLREDGGKSTMGNFLTGMVGNIALETKQAQQDTRHFEAVVGNLENFRKSVSGVNLEEEAVQMMQYQTVFNASAKALKVGDDLLQTILSLKT